MRKIWAILAIALFLMPAAGYASSSDLLGELERADLAARRAAASEEYKGFNPHLTDAQMKEIPDLIKGATERLRSAGYSLGEADVMEGFFMHLEINHGLVFSNSMTIDEVMPDGRVVPQEFEMKLNEKGLLEKRALEYAFVKVIPTKWRGSVKYNPSDYPEISNWEEFHNMCQADMNEIYSLLKYVQDCEWENFQSVFCNLM